MPSKITHWKDPWETEPSQSGGFYTLCGRATDSVLLAEYPEPATCRACLRAEYRIKLFEKARSKGHV